MLASVALLIGVVMIGLRALEDPPDDALARPSAGVAPSRTGAHLVLGLEGKQVPLPAGEWRMIARMPPEGESADAPVISAVLFRLHGHAVTAAMLVQVNRLGQSASWGVAPPCLNESNPSRRLHYASDHDGACSYLAWVDAAGGVGVDPAWRRAVRDAVDRGWNMPLTWMAATFRVTDPHDALQVTYLFHPWALSDDAMPASPAWRRVHTQRLTEWMDTSWPAIAAGFRGRLVTPSEATLRDWEHGDIGKAPHADDETVAARELHERSRLMATRLLSLRMLATVADFGATWLYLGNVATAGALAALRTAVTGVVYLSHEYAWGLVAPAVPARALPGVGTEKPLPP